jgi:zinc-ribbon domain
MPTGPAASERPVRPAVPIAAAQTDSVGQPGQTAAGEQPVADGVEPCPHCGTPLALDQRYCLECGAPRTYLSGMLLQRLQAPSGQMSPEAPALSVQPPQPSSTWQRGNALTLIAGVGVLLLAMGVGVLIGRSGGSSSSAAPAPQVISVGGTATGAASTPTTPTTPEASTATGGAAAAAAAAAKRKAKAAESSGAGSSPSKPAPPTVLKNLHGGSGQSYEQKSKNLPNVVSTG